EGGKGGMGEWVIRSGSPTLPLPHSPIRLPPRPSAAIHVPSHGGGDAAQFAHELVEAVRGQRLAAVGEGLGGVRVHLDDQAVGAGGDAGAGDGADPAGGAGGGAPGEGARGGGPTVGGRGVA